MICLPPIDEFCVVDTEPILNNVPPEAGGAPKGVDDWGLLDPNANDPDEIAGGGKPDGVAAGDEGWDPNVKGFV